MAQWLCSVQQLLIAHYGFPLDFPLGPRVYKSRGNQRIPGFWKGKLMSEDYIGEFEELVLLAILKLAPDAYGTTIIEALDDAGRKTSIGALYATLSRLERKGLISSWMSDPTAERGGRAKKYLKV